MSGHCEVVVGWLRGWVDSVDGNAVESWRGGRIEEGGILHRGEFVAGRQVRAEMELSSWLVRDERRLAVSVRGRSRDVVTSGGGGVTGVGGLSVCRRM